MLALERRRRLLQLLPRTGGLRTTEAARALRVTEETVRRDFEKLEADGSLVRSHGGAVRVESLRREYSADDRAREHEAEKARIARRALGRVRAGETVFFDASTTTLQLARILPDQTLTVLTNSLPVALALLEKPSVRAVLLGGEMVASSQSCTGWLAGEALEHFRLDAAFLSCRGFDAVRGPSEATEAQARLKHRVSERAASVCLLADSSKAGANSSFYFARPGDIDIWITDRAPAPAFRKMLVRQGVRIEVART